MRTHSLSFLIIAILSIGWWSCENNTSTQEPSEQEEETEETTVSGTTYTLTAFTESASFPDAAIESVSYKNGRFDFGLGGESYKLGLQTPDAPQKMCANSAQGQHIHLIVDNQPYAAKYEASFDYDIADGEHYLLAFLSRSYHESIKTLPARVAQKVQVAGKSIQSMEPITDPMIFYSRPKGTYVGKADTEKVMLDFYLVNAKLGANNKVRIDINSEESLEVDQWQPYYIEGLPMGDNKIKLTLLDKEGNPVDSPLNPVERVFTLKEDPAEGE